MNINILIAEDDSAIRNLIKLHLEKEGYNVIEAADGLEAIQKLQGTDIDLFILDIMMPKANGLQVLADIRDTSTAPVIMLTALGEDQDKVLGLDLGADDYMVKPFSVFELLSRVRAHLRRQLEFSDKATTRHTVLKNGNLKLDEEHHAFKIDDEAIELNPTEFKILAFFMKNPGRVFTKKQLYEEVWGELYHGDDNTIMVHISHLRDKVEANPKTPKIIKTIRGVGYRMERL